MASLSDTYSVDCDGSNHCRRNEPGERAPTVCDTHQQASVLWGHVDQVGTRARGLETKEADAEADENNRWHRRGHITHSNQKGATYQKPCKRRLCRTPFIHESMRRFLKKQYFRFVLTVAVPADFDDLQAHFYSISVNLMLNIQ